MFIVESTQTLKSDIQHAIRYITNDPRKALAAAKEIQSEKDKSDELFVNHVSIYQLEVDKLLYLSDYRRESKNHPIVYVGWINLNETVWREKFNGAFKIYKRRRLGTNNRDDEKAAPGMFRAVISFDSDEVWQIYEDVPTAKEAYELCIGAAGTNYFFCVFDDQGNPQTKDGQLM